MGLWDTVGTVVGGAGGFLLGGPAGAALGAAAGGGLGSLADGKPAVPQYQDPNAAKRKILADNLMSAKTGEEYTAHQSAMNEHRGQQLFDQVSRDFSGNPAVSNSLYNNIERNTENENVGAGIEGARINQENQRSAANILNEDSQLGFKEWTANTDRASMPSPLETIATNALGSFAGNAAGAAGRKLGSGGGGGGGNKDGLPDNGGPGGGSGGGDGGPGSSDET